MLLKYHKECVGNFLIYEKSTEVNFDTYDAHQEILCKSRFEVSLASFELFIHDITEHFVYLLPTDLFTLSLPIARACENMQPLRFL